MIDPRHPDYHSTPVSHHRARYGYRPADPMTPPAVSIVTTFFNTGEVFRETVASVMSQSFQQWEWILVNDGSTDPASVALLNEFRAGDPRIRVVDHPETRGPSAARNTGFREVRTEYVAMLDSDDLLEPTAIEKWFWNLITFPEHAFVKGYGVGFGAQEYLWPHGFHSGTAFLQENLADVTSMVRRSVHAQVGGFDEQTRRGLEDWEFWLRCAASGYWGGTVPEYLNWYRRRSSHTDRWQNLDPGRMAEYRGELQRRYPALWQGKFPRIAHRPPQPYAPMRDECPAANILDKSSSRVLLIVPWLALGGADKYNLDVVHQLTARGCEVSIATTLEGDHSWMPEFARYTPDVFPLSHFLRLVDYPRFLRYLIRSRQIDTVLISNAELGYRLLPYLRSCFPEVTFVDYCHMEEETWNNGGYPRFAVQYQETLDLNIVSSHHLRTWMIHRGADASRVEVCYTNIDTEQWHPDAARGREERTQLAIPHDVPVLLFPGRIVRQKQPQVFLETIRRLHVRNLDFRAVVAGDGPDLEDLRKKTGECSLSAKVLFLGAVSNARVRSLMQMADILFLPSQWEGIALTVYEAMASGLAVVGANVGGQRELVTDDAGILVPPSTLEQEAEEYAGHLEGLITDRNALERMRCAGRLRVSRHFTLSCMGDRLMELLVAARYKHVHEPRAFIAPALGRSCALEALEAEHSTHQHWWYAGLTDAAVTLFAETRAHIECGRIDTASALLQAARRMFADAKDDTRVRQIDAQITGLQSLVPSEAAPSLPDQGEEPLVSVVIPCYRQAEFLPEAMASVLAQTYPRWEIIVVNDGSPDATSAVVREWMERHPECSIRLIEQTNSGPAAARNAGCRASRGAYCLPLDADDRIAPTFIERTLSVAIEHPDVGFVYTHIQHFGDRSDLFPLPEFDAHTMTHVDNTASVCALVRKTMWEEVGGYDASMREGYEDWDFWVGCIAKGWKGYRVPEGLFHYRVRAGSRLRDANTQRLYFIGLIVLNHPELYEPAILQWANAQVSAHAGGGSLVPEMQLPRLRITYLINNIQGVTGGNQTLLHQVNALAQRGHTLTVVTYSDPPVWFHLTARIIHVPPGKSLAGHVPESDIVIATYFLNALELPQIKTPVKIYFAQGDQFLFEDASQAARENGAGPSTRLAGMSRRSYMLPGVHILTNSSVLSRKIAEISGREVAGQLPVCIDHAVFAPLPRLHKDGRMRILVVGPDNPGTEVEPLTFKGIGDIRRALDLLPPEVPPFTVIRVSNTPPALFKDYPCEFHLTPDEREKTRLFGTADILVYASHYDSCPRPPLEAMGSGAAVICTSTDGAREYCRHEQNALLVPPGSPEDIAAAIHRLMIDSRLRERLVRGGCETAAMYPEKREWDELERLLYGVHGNTYPGRQVPESTNQPEDGRPSMLTVVLLVESPDLQQTQHFLRELTGGTRRIDQLILAPCAVPPATVAWLRAETSRHAEWLLLDEGDSPIEAWTGGARHAEGGLLCFVRDGLMVPEFALEGLEEVLRDSSVAGIVTPLILSGRAGEERTMHTAAFRERNRFRRLKAQSLAPACFMIRRDVWDAAGWFGTGENEPEDLAVRVAMLGLDVVVAADIALIWKVSPPEMRGSSLPLIRGRLQQLRRAYPVSGMERLKLYVLDVLAQAEVHEHAGNGAQGVRVLSDAITQYPESPALHAARAWMLIRDGKYEEVSRLLPETPDVVKRDSEWLDITGFCMQGLGEGVLARQCVDKAIGKDARDARAFLLKGMLAVDEGNAEDAESAFREAISIDPSFGEPYAHLGALLWAREERTDAEVFIERGFILAPAHREVLATFAELAQREGYAEHAEQRVAEARSLLPVHRDLAYLHAGLLRMLERDHEALEVLMETLAHTGLEDSALDEAFTLRGEIGPRETDGGQGTISLCMIVRNEEAHLARCLSSVAPFVDEMVVVDTGSIDRTPLLAAVFGARVFTQSWSEDFAAARNAALARARGEWILVLDADEVISPRDGEALRRLAGATRAGYVLTTRNYVREMDLQGWRPNDGGYHEEAGTGWLASPKVRFFPRDPACVFENPVHEIIEPSLTRLGIPIRVSDIPVHHYGRLDAQRTRQKAEQYAVIGRRKLADRGHKDPRALFELAAQEQELGRHAEAADLWREYVRMAPGDAHGQLALGVSLAALGKLQEARCALRIAIQGDNSPQEASVKCALIELQLGNAEAALTILASPAQAVSEYPYTLATRAAALLCTGRAEEAGQVRNRLAARRITSSGFFSTLAHDLETAGQHGYAAAVRAVLRPQEQPIG